MRNFRLFLFLGILTGVLISQTAPAPAAAGQTNYREKAERIRTLLNKGEIEKAQKSADEALASSPENAELLAAAGDVYYRMANMAKALSDYQAALKADPKCARALFGLARLHESNSNHATAHNLINRAHQLDPGDPEVQHLWMKYLPLIDRISLSANATYPDENEKEHKQRIESATTLLKLLDGHSIKELVGAPEKKTLPLQPLMRDANHQTGIGLRVSINGSKPLTLMLDTGASGILLKSNVAERVNLKRIGAGKFSGIGDKGLADGYSAFADSVSVEGLEFKNFVMDVVEGNDTANSDGLIGADVFDQFLITIDFAKLQLKLDPLPGAVRSSEDAKLTDRTIPPGMEMAAKTYRVGHQLYIQAKADGIGPTFFLIDTGSFSNMLAEAIAKQVKGYSQDVHSSVKGLNGLVSRVYRIDEVNLATERFRQKTRGMIVIDVDRLSQSAGFEIGGIFGYPLLRDFQVTIDYRDGLIDFKYVGKPRNLFDGVA